MDLHQQLPPHCPQLFIPPNLHHARIHNICSPSLNRSIDSPSIGHSQFFIPRVWALKKFMKFSITAHQCLSNKLVLCNFLLFFLPNFNFLSLLKPSLNDLFGLIKRTAPIIGKSPGAFAISDGKIDSLCFFPLRRILLFQQRHRSCPFRLVPLNQNCPFVYLLPNIIVHSNGRPRMEVST